MSDAVMKRGELGATRPRVIEDGRVDGERQGNAVDDESVGRQRLGQQVRQLGHAVKHSLDPVTLLQQHGRRRVITVAVRRRTTSSVVGGESGVWFLTRRSSTRRWRRGVRFWRNLSWR